jgi:hypothetical protein
MASPDRSIAQSALWTQVWCISVAWFFLLIDNSGGQMVKYFGLRTPFHKASAVALWRCVCFFWGNCGKTHCIHWSISFLLKWQSHTAATKNIDDIALCAAPLILIWCFELYKRTLLARYALVHWALVIVFLFGS